MKKRKMNFSLLGLTFAFSVFGLATVFVLAKQTFTQYFCYQDGKVYRSSDVFDQNNKSCVCSSGNIVCEVKREVVNNQTLTLKDFSTTGLQFEPSYLSSKVSTELENSDFKTVFTEVRNTDNGVTVIMRQAQSCTSDLKLPPQFGMFNFSNNTLTLLNNVNTLSSVYSTPCVVEIKYTIANIQVDPQTGFKLQYSNQEGDFLGADVCVYNQKIFNDGDKYYAKDSCNVCTCTNGESLCTTNSCK